MSYVSALTESIYILKSRVFSLGSERVLVVIYAFTLVVVLYTSHFMWYWSSHLVVHHPLI